MTQARLRRVLAPVLAIVVAAVVATPAARAQDLPEVPQKPAGAVRFATFNVSLYGDAPGDIAARLADGTHEAARLSAEIVQRVRPDVLLVQEIDRDEEGLALSRYAENYLAVGQGGAAPIDYPHRLVLPSNTGVPTGVDLNGDGVVGESGIDYALDARGFGRYPGQYGFSLLSRLPLGGARTFSDFLWRDMPHNRILGDLSHTARAVLPLSSKTHALVPVETPGGTIHVAAAHPTPPIRPDLAVRNADEIRLIADLLDAEASGYARDDEGRAGGLAEGTFAVVMGDLNADPRPGAGDSLEGAIAYLLESPRVVDPEPMSPSFGALTAQFSRGRMRVDYVVPTANLDVLQSGVFWPAERHPLNGASDHRLVWVDVRIREE